MTRRVNVFEGAPDIPLFIVSDAPPSSCNYRCPYCPYHFGIGFRPYEDEFHAWTSALLTAVRRIRRPLYLCIGPRGEPLEVEAWWPVFREVLSYDHVRSAAFVSNLSKPIGPFIEGLDPHRIGVTGTIHPTQWKQKESGLAQFSENVFFLKEIGAKVVLNYVLAPYQLSDYAWYKKHFEDQGVAVTCNVFRGVHKGKRYPESYTAEELALARELMADIPFEYAFQSKERSPFGNLCTASRYAINLESDGSMFPCYFVRNRLGSIFDQELMLYDEDFTCTSQTCECKWSIPLQREFVRIYRHVGNVHEVVRRAPGEVGWHPFV